MKHFINKNLIAHEHINKSVLHINDDVLELNDIDTKLVGVKNVSVLTPTIKFLVSNFNFKLHTIDKKSEHNRATDLDLINPLTTKFMSGSSSGSAFNVFKDVNDIGVGTDGGGSVLAPSINLNLYSFISKHLDVVPVVKTSTDNIEFKVSAGLISKDIQLLLEVYNKINKQNEIIPKVVYFKTGSDPDIDFCDLSISYDRNLSRTELITLVKPYLKDYVIISYEDKIDTSGIDESIISSLDPNQHTLGNKGLLRIANMLNCDAFSIPVNVVSSGFIVMANDKSSSIVSIVKKFKPFKNELIKRYYNSDNYSDDKYIMED